MSTPTSPTRTLLGTLLAVGVVGLGYLQSRTAAELSALRLQAAERSTAEAAFRESAQETLDRINAEISRMRVEQRIGSQGPKALLEMLRIHADTLVNARATAPDFQNAQEQMRGVMRAFAAIGEDGTAPVFQTDGGRDERVGALAALAEPGRAEALAQRIGHGSVGGVDACCFITCHASSPTNGGWPHSSS
jgi:hypothetical protein